MSLGQKSPTIWEDDPLMFILYDFSLYVNHLDLVKRFSIMGSVDWWWRTWYMLRLEWLLNDTWPGYLFTGGRWTSGSGPKSWRQTYLSLNLDSIPHWYLGNFAAFQILPVKWELMIIPTFRGLWGWGEMRHVEKWKGYCWWECCLFPRHC